MPDAFSRPDKETDAQTVLYEIDMFRFAGGRLLRGRFESDKDRWAYLESFLVHYRNLIEFLGKKDDIRATDIHVSNIWEKTHLPEPAELPELRKQGEVLWDKYERVDDRISRYLQHCTTQRTQWKQWEVGTMSNELEPVLVVVERSLRGAGQTWSPERQVAFIGRASNSTASFAVGPAIVIPEPFDGAKK
jgi:hypothetical protein